MNKSCMKSKAITIDDSIKTDNEKMNMNSEHTIDRNKNNYSIYCISCFNYYIWNSQLYNLEPINKEVTSIKNLSQEPLLYDPNYCVSIHQINFNDKIKKLNLSLISLKNNKTYPLNEINIQLDKEKILFVDLNVNSEYIYSFLNELKENNNIQDKKYDNKKMISRNISLNEKLNIFLDYFKKEAVEDDLKQNLVSQYLLNLKDDNTVIYSDIIKIFNLSFNTKIITDFLDTYPKLDFALNQNINNEEFNKILNLYKENKNNFFEKNIKIFAKVKAKKDKESPVDNYKNLLENFITIYQLFNEDIKTIDKQRLVNVRETLKSLINNKPNLFSYISFIDFKFDSFFLVFTSDCNEKIKVKKKLIENQIIDFEQFESFYNLLMEEQLNRGRLILDFSQIFNYFVDTIDDYKKLTELKKIYKKEIEINQNDYFKDKIRAKIHNSGLQKIKTGSYDNKFMFHFLKYNEYYSSKQFKNNINKNFDILQYFKKDLMDDKFFEDYNKYHIYSYFEEDLQKYFSFFFKNIKEVKDFGLFFKILPQEKNNKETINFIVNWLKENIYTFSIEKCPNFINEIKLFYEIMNSKKLITNMNNIIEILYNTIGEYSIQIYIELLNSIKNLPLKTIEPMINHILNIKEDNFDDSNPNIYLFLDKIIPNKNIVKTFLSKISCYVINKEEFYYKEKSEKFVIFDKLLNSKEYSILTDESNKSSVYWQNTYHICSLIIQDLKNYNIVYKEVKSTFNPIGENNIQKRINNMVKCLNEEDYELRGISILTNINAIMDDWGKKMKSIELLKEYNLFINNLESKSNEELSKYNRKIMESTLQCLTSKESMKEFSKYENNIKTAKEVLNLKKSKVFLNILKHLQNSMISNKILDISLEKLNNIKKVFVNNKEIINKELINNKDIKYLIHIAYNNNEEFIKEIDWLLNHFKIYDFNCKDFLITKIKIIVENKSLFSALSGILNFYDIFKDIFNFNNNEDVAFYNDFCEYKKKIKNTKNISEELIREIDLKIENFFNISSNDRDKKMHFFNFFISVNQCPDSIKYLCNKKSEQVNNLNEFLLESDDRILTEKDIKDFIKVVKFFEEIIENKEINTYNYFVRKIYEGILDEEKCRNSLNNYIGKYNLIQDLLNKYLNHTDGCIKKIKNILNESFFNIGLNQDKQAKKNIYSIEGTCIGTFNNNYSSQHSGNINNIEDSPHFKNKNKNILFVFFPELEYIFQRIYIAKIPEEYKDIVNLFISFFSNIKQLMIILNELYSKGYHENFEIKFIFHNSELKCVYDDQKVELEKLMDFFYKLKTGVFRQLEMFYKEKKIIRLFYGRQLYLIYNNIINNEENKNLDLFKIAFNNKIKNLNNKISLNFSIKQEKGFHKYIKIIEEINNYIEMQLKYNKIYLKDIYELNKIKKIEKPLHSNNLEKKNEELNEYKGIYFYMSNKNQELQSLCLYLYMTKNIPINNCFFYCTKDTKKEELQTFIYRAIYSNDNYLFCMVNTNCLNNVVRRFFLRLIKKLSKKIGQSMESCLIIIFSANDQEMQKLLLRAKNIQPFTNKMAFIYNFTFDSDFNDNYKITLIKSSSCGLGKTEFIENNDIKKKKLKNKHNYFYFPIGGTFTREKLIQRIMELPDMSDINKEFIIHFDITQTKNIQLLNEFFFKLLVLRKCDINENAKYFGRNVEIMIEIPNDFTDYVEEIPLLSKFKIENINNIKIINLSPELTIVSNMLTMFETNDILKKQSEINKINLKLTQEQCQNIIMKYLKTIEIEKPNYYQINIFIKVLSDEFSKFSRCEGYTVETLCNNAFGSGLKKDDVISLINLRKFIINSLVKVTKLFLVGPYEKLIKNQEINQKLMKENDDEKEKFINQNLTINIDSVSFDEIKPSLVVFNEDGDSCTIITTCPENDSEFKTLQKLYNTQNKRETLRSFRSLGNEEILNNLLNFLNVSGFDDKQKKKILGTYVYTPDNFIKVVLILLRIRVKIPVILMGETGCGKTTLIEMASKLINKGNIFIKKMNIHAGINDEDIIQFMKKVKDDVEIDDRKYIKNKKNEFNNQSEENKRAYLKSRSIERIYAEYEEDVKKRKIWIFFDEINTCNSMGLLTEIFCKNTIYGKALDDRYVYFAACNPYRISKKENIISNFLCKKNQKKKNLVYTVNPLPLTLLNFVFNFGSLKPNDEKRYIESMILETIHKIFEKINNNNEDEKKKLITIETECVESCQNYMKNNNDISVVSLREVNRYNVFVEFFVDYLSKRKNNKDLEQNLFEEDEIINYYNSKTDIEIVYAAINLSLFICYYLRLPDKDSRRRLENSLNKNKYFSNGDFLKIPKMEQNYILNNFEVPKGIAKNRSLKENIFICFFCIINKMPIITCGKPGRSKTLSFKIIQNSMKGEASKSLFFRQYKEITTFQIQGSLNTTSIEILEVFQKARNYQKNNMENKSVVVFMDEMGLAEISDNNPLKVMHSELEEEENKISFVGISNWFIDASKMNRVVYNVVQDPDEEDLIETGKEIANSYGADGENYSEKYKNIIERLAKSYYKYINKKKIQNDKNQNFHGSRDFYSLIKSVMNDIIKNKAILDQFDNEGDEDEANKLLNKICLNHIMRNFGGLEDSIEEMKSFFFTDYEDILNSLKEDNQYNMMKCIKENMNDDSSRYLLLITDSYLSQELLNYMLEEIYEERELSKNNNIINENKEKDGIELFDNKNIKKKEIFKKYYSGSKFQADRNNILYSNEMLNKIKYQMETDNILILKDLESVYPSLYELFNQSFTYLDKKKFVRLGSSESFSLVNNKFNVIVLVEKSQIDNQEEPFLNRFEKHIINFSSLLNQQLLSLEEEIYQTLKEINKININSKFNIEERFKKYMNFINEEEIKGLIYIASKKLNNINDENGNINKNLIIEFVLQKIAPCFKEELMILISKYDFKNKYNFYYKCLYESYKKNYSYNFKNYLENITSEISIVYTFSSILDDIINDENEKIILNNNKNINFAKNTTIEINISSIITMDQIDKEIIDFLFNEKIDKNLLLLKFREEDLNKLNDIYYLLNAYMTNKGNRQSKIAIFVIYLQKNTKTINYMSFLSDCPQIMISNLNNVHLNFPEILVSSNIEIIEKNLVDINSIINNNIDEILRFFNYKLFNCDEQQKNMYKISVSFYIKNQEYLKDILIKTLSSLTKNDDDFLIKVFNESLSKKKDSQQIDILDSLFNIINSLVFEKLRIIIIILEKEQIINSLIFNEKNCQNEIIQKHIYNFISNIDNVQNNKFNWKNKNINQKVNINVLLEQKYPFCENIFKSLFNYIQDNIAKKYLEKDTFFFSKRIKDTDVENEQKKYLNELKKLDNNLKIELFKYPIIVDILSSNNEELISNLFQDCFYIFIKKNNKFISKYSFLSELLDLLIQLRLKTRINNELSIHFIDKEKIEIYPSFIQLIKDEYNNSIEDKVETQLLDKKENNIYICKFVSILNFLQSYSKEINLILESYYLLLDFISPLYENIVIIIEEKKIQMECSERNQYYSRINKFSFFYIIEALCKLLKEKINNVLNDKNFNSYNKKKEFFSLIQTFSQNVLKLEKRFLLFSQEVFTLDIITRIITEIGKNNINKDKDLLEFTSEILSTFLSDYNKRDVEGVLKLQNVMLIKIFGNNLDEYSILMNKILLNYYKSEYNMDLREKIIKNILLEEKFAYNDKLLQYSYPLIQLLFKFSSFEPSILKGQKEKFLDNFNNNTDSIKEYINDKNNEKINDIFLFRFEIICDNYFKKIKDKKKDKKDEKKEINEQEKLCGDLSKNYLEKAIKYIYYKNPKIKLNNICKLFCIAYIKRYLIYFIDILYHKESFQKFPDRDEVHGILYNDNIKEKETIMFYCLKLILKQYDNDWENFSEFYEKEKNNDSDDIFSFKKYYKKNNKIIEISSNDSLYYVPILLLNTKKAESDEYIEMLSKNNLDDKTKKIFDNLFLKNNSYELLFSFLSNILILYYATKIKKDKDNYKNLILSIIGYLKNEKKIIDKDINNFFYTFFDLNNFNGKILSKIGKKEGEKDIDNYSNIIILFYALRFIFSILIYSKNTKNGQGFYLSLLTKNISTILESGFIPGTFPNNNLKIQSFYEIKQLLEQDHNKYGAYLCSCGYHYSIDKCTFPRVILKCPICGQLIGGSKGILVRREGHIRIFYDEESRRIKLKKKNADKDIPNKLLKELEEEIETDKKQLFKGLKLIDKNTFLKEEENIREMDAITYRFLNFILYSFIFYSNIQEIIKDKHLKKYTIDNMECFEIMKKNWELMEKILNDVQIEIFLNIIFDDVVKKFTTCPIFKTSEEVINFEKDINKIITDKLKDKNLINDYQKKNNELLQVSKDSIKAIIQELYPPNKYTDKDYPNLKYFYMSELPGKDHFITKFNSKEKNKENYPILNSIINNEILKKRIQLMKYLPKINKLCNKMIDYVSFKYSREEAKKILIKDEITDEEINDNLLNEFVSIYKKIRPYIKQEGCHEFGDLYQELDNNLYLSNVCVDSGEMGFGLVLLAMYKDMAEWQNSFIDSVINSPNEYLKNYKDLFNSKIMIQDCEEENILNLPSFDNSNNKDMNLMEIVANNSFRKDKEVIYNYNEIENELASFILPKIKSFNLEFRKVIYQYECFVGDRSSIIINFIEKYQQRELTDKELIYVIKFIMENGKNNKFKIKNLLFSLQILIDIVMDSSPNINTTLYSFTQGIENSQNIEIIKEFFKAIKENMENDNIIIDGYFTINSLINLIDIVELFCWDIIKNNLDTKYLEDINENIKLQFDSFYNNIKEEEKQNIMIKKIDLCSAIRKFISRYLSGKSEENINPKNKLKNYLTNVELWPIDYYEIDVIEEEINQIFGNVEVELSQTMKLFDYLGGDNSKLDEIKKIYEQTKKKNKSSNSIKQYNFINNPNKINDNENDINSNYINDNNKDLQKNDQDKDDDEDGEGGEESGESEIGY